MKIVHVNSNGDPAGVSWLLHDAMVRARYNSRHITLAQHIHKVIQGQDILADKKPGLAEQALKEADLLHINGYLRADIRTFQGNFNFNLDKHLHKPFILHNHGGCVLLNPYPQINEAKKYNKKFKYWACSPLTKHVIPHAKWMPNIVPINNPLYLPTERDFKGEIKVCQKIFSGDVRPWKGTFVLHDTINMRLKEWFKYPIKFTLFQGESISNCLKLSADYQVCVDNITQGFIGMSGWESLSKGQVVVSRLDPIVEEAYKKFGNGTCPIINVSGMDELAKVLRELCNDRDYLKKKSIESRKWMEKYYNEERIVKLYVKEYEKVLSE